MVKRNKLFVGMAVGAIVGAAIGLLMAPKSGQETREVIRGKTGQYAQALRGRFKRNRGAEILEDQGNKATSCA